VTEQGSAPLRVSSSSISPELRAHAPIPTGETGTLPSSQSEGVSRRLLASELAVEAVEGEVGELAGLLLVPHSLERVLSTFSPLRYLRGTLPEFLA